MSSGRDENNPPHGHESTQSSPGITRQLSITNNRLDSRELFIGTRDITILHGNDSYHLRITAQNKLILTK
jgi:hemin uptake protein HemP